MKIPKELIKEYVKSENFTNTTDIMESIKSMFADVLNSERLQRQNLYFLMMIHLEKCCILHHKTLLKSGRNDTRTGILLSVSLKSCMRIMQHKRWLCPRTPEV